MRLSINIESGNSAFATGDNSEVVRILRDLAARLETGDALADHVTIDRPIYDVNGNKVGAVKG